MTSSPWSTRTGRQIRVRSRGSCAALLDGADFAKGTRFVAGGGSSDITRLRRLGNRVLAAVVNLSHGTRYSDLCYGFNVFWRQHVPVLGLDTSSPPQPAVTGAVG